MYKHKEIESKWQKYWEDNKTYKTTDNSKNKFYVLDMFPYPSGSGLHVGHPEGYTATDIIARYKRLKGFDVLHPIGWDAFGLPAEQYALKTKNHPDTFTEKNIRRFRRQLKSLGFSFDYDKEVNTTDPNYYKTTQWIFSKIYEKGLAEIRDIDVNWSEDLGTVLANEEVIDDENGNPVSEVGNFPVIKKPMRQWVLKITKYAKRLYDGLEDLDWPEGLKNLQRNWIYNDDGSLHLQDWIFSRQRYWGEPFPVAFDNKGKIKIIKDLPVTLPHMKEFRSSGTGESPLANASDWLFFEENKIEYRRETNTMPQWAGSCWYYLAYIMKQDDGKYLDISSKKAYKEFEKWLPVDLYIGGQEHAVLHLLYARFWHMVLYDLGVVPTPEPFEKIVNQGMILGPNGQKMSKSKGNVINPDDIVEEHGADTLRVYEMFMGPLEETKPWSDESIKGIRKWLERIWRLYSKEVKFTKKTSSEYNTFVKEVEEDIKALKFNTAISKMMVYINYLYKTKEIAKEEAKGFLTILSLFAPHIAEELLEKLKLENVASSAWPTYDKKNLKAEQKVIAVQVNGKLRATLEITGKEKREEIIERAKSDSNVSKYLEKGIKKEIYVPGKIINFVI